MSWFKRLFGKPEVPVAAQSTPANLAKKASAPEFPFPLVAVHGAVAEQEWRRLQTAWRAEGCSAVLLGDRQDVEDRRESMKYEERPPEAVIDDAANNPAEGFFERRRKEYAEDELDLPDDDWPKKNVAPGSLTAHLEMSGKPKPLVHIARVPTPHPWEIPAYLKIGGWNDCPAAEDQVAVLRHWSERHDIEVFSATGDVLECVVARPPTTREDAMKLAREQFLYCSDIVHQGTETIAALAATLLNSRVWYFWWD